MATTFVEYTGDGQASKQFTFPSYQESDVKVRVDGVLKTTSTHYNITNYTTTGGGNVVFTSGNIPSSPANIRIYRDTNVDVAKATYTAGSSVKAADLNNNNTQLLYRAQEEQVPNLIQSYDIEGDAIDGTKIADNSINSEHYVDGSIDHVHLANDVIDGDNIQDDVINSEHYAAGSIDEEHLSNSAITSNKIADNAVTTTEILNGAVTAAKLATDAVTAGKIQTGAVTTNKIADTGVTAAKLATDAVTAGKLATGSVTTNKLADTGVTSAKLATDAVTAGKIATNAVTTAKIADDAVTNAKIADGTLDGRYFTETELLNGALDGRYFTETEADNRYFNVSTGDTIKDGDTFPDNDTTIATTAAINDRIIDLVDDVGGFVPIANETSFPTSNPDINLSGSAKGGTIVSVSAASTNLVPSGTTVTIANGRGSGLPVVITGVSATIPSGFGFLVETTSTDHTYAFHRLVPKATEVTTVAGSISGVNTVAGAISNVNAVAGNATNINTVAANNTNVTNVGGNISNVNAVHANASNINTVAGINANVTTVAGISSNVTSVANNSSNINSAVSNASNINSAVSNASNINTVAGSISNVNTTAGSISNVNTVASNISNVNSFFNVYRIGSSNPTTSLDTGDLFFNTTSNSLKVYTGSAWVDGVTATGNFAVVTGNTFTGSNNHNDNVKSIYGTGSDLEIYHDGFNSHIRDSGAGNLNLDGSQINIHNPNAHEAMARFIENGAVQLYYDNSKKLETTSTGATVTGVLISDGLTLLDNEKILFGNNNDLEIFHNGTNNIIQSDVGDLQINSGNSAGDVVINTNNNVNNDTRVTSAKFIKSGAVELYHNNSKKFETTSDGYRSNDNVKAQFGNSSDLEIFHSVPSSNLIRANNGGSIFIRCGSDNMVSINDSQEVALGYDGSTKLQTTSGGVNILGALTVNGSAINTDLVSDTSPQLGGTLDTNNNNIHFNDNVSARFGTSQDLDIFHDGNRSAINNNTGELRILSNNDVVIGKRSGGNTSYSELLAAFKVDGSVELYHDNGKRFETTQYGVTVTGSGTNPTTDSWETNSSIITSGSYGGGIAMIDGSAGFVQSLDGSGANYYLRNATTTSTPETSIKAVTNNTVELYYDNSKKLETTSSGVDITGTTTDDGARHDGDVYFIGATSGRNAVWDMSDNALEFADNAYLKLGTGSDLQIHHNGSNSFIENTTGNLHIRAKAGENSVAAEPNAGVQLYYDNSKMLETDANGVIVGDGKRYTVGDDADGYLRYINNTVELYVAHAQPFKINLGSETALLANANGAVELYHNGNRQVFTIDGGLNWQDNKKAEFGNSGDLKIYHTGSESIIGNATGTFQFLSPNEIRYRATTHHFLSYGNDETMAKFNDDGAVDLYFDNHRKLSTTSTGIQIPGNCAIHLDNGNWTGNTTKIQHHSNFLYLVGGSNGIIFREGGTDRAVIDGNGHLRPGQNNTYDLGTSSNKWRNVYTNDLHLSNEGHSNDVDGTWGNWTIQEGESDLFLKNNRSGKKYKFNLTEVS